MSTIKTGRKVIQILKRNGYEAYFVGGVVRDHLLKMPINDIDITTNAKPHQVAKLFDTKPTGLKYGTVTVLFNDEAFEVTTYRIDGISDDHRHPNEVIFSETVEEDVKRRDFRINGLIMDENNEIFDYVGGKADIKAKMIQTIGDPQERFTEDALRIMRAFYFQSKLGFQIAKITREAIEENRELLKEVAMERILQELIKILKGSHVDKAIHSIVSTKVHEVLPGLKEGILFAQKNDRMPYVDAFFTLSFALYGSVPKEWPFSNIIKYRYQTASMLANKYTKFDDLTLYTYGLDLCLLANRVNYLLGRSKNYKQQIEHDFSQLPIQSELDLKLRPQEMVRLANKKAGAWIHNTQQKMIEAILKQELKNEEEALIDFLMEEIRG